MIAASSRATSSIASPSAGACRSGIGNQIARSSQWRSNHSTYPAYRSAISWRSVKHTTIVAPTRSSAASGSGPIRCFPHSHNRPRREGSRTSSIPPSRCRPLGQGSWTTISN
jgi:hypothetical protein